MQYLRLSAVALGAVALGAVALGAVALGAVALCVVALDAVAQTEKAPAPLKAVPTQPVPSRPAQWRMRYFYDETRSSFQIVDLAFPSASRGIAVGFLRFKGKQTLKPVAVVTSDGGKTWSTVNLDDHPRSLFFLNENVGWMVGSKGLWRTEEAGRSWKRVWSKEGLLRVWFNSETRGWAVGAPKAAFETSDGEHWSKLEIAEQVQSREETTVYDWVVFATPQMGTIIGSSRVPRRRLSDAPAWADPEAARSQKEWPAMSIFIETHDGGKKWGVATGSLFGHIARVRMTTDGRALAVFEYRDHFEYPSEVYRMDLRTGKNATAFRNKNRAVTDVALVDKGPAYLAAIEATGPLAYSPIPAKVRMMKSDDLELWQDMKVDYRAVASWVCLAVAPPDHVWAATDTGMILELTRD